MRRARADSKRTMRLTGADLITAHGFVQVPYAVINNSEITPGAKLCYTMLLSYAWYDNFQFPGQKRLAQDMGVSLRSANTYIKELERKKFLSVQRQGQGRPNVYTLHLDTRKSRRKS